MRVRTLAIAEKDAEFRRAVRTRPRGQRSKTHIDEVPYREFGFRFETRETLEL